MGGRRRSGHPHQPRRVPLGNYRFKVETPDFTIFSDPFEVVPATLSVTAALSGTEITATSRVHADKGWRLMHMDLDSNGPVPVRNGTFSVSLALSGGGTLDFTDVAGNGGGAITVDAGAEAANVISVTVTDAFGNTGTDTL